MISCHQFSPFARYPALDQCWQLFPVDTTLAGVLSSDCFRLCHSLIDHSDSDFYPAALSVSVLIAATTGVSLIASIEAVRIPTKSDSSMTACMLCNYLRSATILSTCISMVDVTVENRTETNGDIILILNVVDLLL